MWKFHLLFFISLKQLWLPLKFVMNSQHPAFPRLSAPSSAAAVPRVLIWTSELFKAFPWQGIRLACNYMWRKHRWKTGAFLSGPGAMLKALAHSLQSNSFTVLDSERQSKLGHWQRHREGNAFTLMGSQGCQRSNPYIVNYNSIVSHHNWI